MLARNATIFKWLLYGGATLVFFFLQGFLLQRLVIWGVIPFLYPMLVAVLGIYEPPLPASVYGLVVGVICDLLLPAPIPCFYTLVFPFAGLLASLLSQSLLPAGFFCGLIASLISFFLTDLFHCLLLWISGKAAWQSGAVIFLKEFLVTLVLIIPVVLLYSAVFRRTHLDD